MRLLALLASTAALRPRRTSRSDCYVGVSAVYRWSANDDDVSIGGVTFEADEGDLIGGG